MSIIINLLLFIIVLGVIIFIHELGHFTWAKIYGVYVYEFALGMGPKLFGKKIGETEYTIRAIPIGGFCQLAGEELEEDDNIPKNRRLQAKTKFQRFMIMVFGPMNNFILAIILLFIIAMVWGGATMAPVFSEVENGSAAYKAGLRSGDKVVEINSHKIKTSDDITLYLAIADPKKRNEIVVEKNGINVAYEVKPEKIKRDGKEAYKYGVAMIPEKTSGFGEAIVYTGKKTCSIFKQMFVTVGYLFTGGIKLNQLAGPVGIYSIVGESSKAGISNLIYLIAFLSINVGFINLLPIPAFDGGHILFIIIELLKGSPVKLELQYKIQTVFLMLLMLLMLIVTFNDILRLF